MAKDFLDEVIDALNELRLAEAQRVYEAVKNKECPPLTMKPSTVIKTVHQVAMKHQITAEELRALIGLTPTLTAEESATLMQTAEKLD